MAELNRELLHHLAELCRIGMPVEEEESFFTDLKKILNYIDLLNEVNTDDVSPCNHVIPEMQNVMREDIVGATLPREIFLANAPEHTGGMIRVPPVIRKTPS